MAIPVIDLFAGPGGLGEGFSSVLDENNERVFDIKLSIEKEENAHKTLTLRSFFRKFPLYKVPNKYYEVLKEKNLQKREEKINDLFTSYPAEAEEALNEAWHFEMPYPEEFDKEGNKKGGYTATEIIERNAQIDNRIKSALSNYKNFVLIGGPPCQAYSLVGRSRNKGISATDHRVHLYKEYLRIIAKHHPAVFVMENVKGLLSSKVDGKKIFELIKKDLRKPGRVYPEMNSPEYKIYSLVKEPDNDLFDNPEYKKDTDYLIKTENYGVPQKRHRVILLGIRKDLNVKPGVLTEKEEVTLKQVISDLPPIRSGLNRKFKAKEIIGDKIKRYYDRVNDNDKNWITYYERNRNEIREMNGLSKAVSNGDIKVPENGIGAEYIPYATPSENNPLHDWYKDVNNKVNGVCNHQSRSHLIEDLLRYMFSAVVLKKENRFPRLNDYLKYNKKLMPDHENAKSGKFADRFRVQAPDRPATTVTSHISKDGHYFIHYKIEQCRSLTVREAARIQTFPDNYLFRGSRTKQFHQVGNAVPPYLAYKIAKVVFEIFDEIQQQKILLKEIDQATI